LGAKTSRNALLVWRLAPYGCPLGNRTNEGSLHRVAPSGKVRFTNRLQYLTLL